MRDELGYVPYAPEGAQLFFRFLARRYERGSVLITSNLEFGERGQIFGVSSGVFNRCSIFTLYGRLLYSS